MFESLGDRLAGVFKELRGEGHLTDFHLDTALRQIRLALLEADVALPVVRDFTARVKEKAVGAKVTVCVVAPSCEAVGPLIASMVGMVHEALLSVNSASHRPYPYNPFGGPGGGSG